MNVISIKNFRFDKKHNQLICSVYTLDPAYEKGDYDWSKTISNRIETNKSYDWTLVIHNPESETKVIFEFNKTMATKRTEGYFHWICKSITNENDIPLNCVIDTNIENKDKYKKIKKKQENERFKSQLPDDWTRIIATASRWNVIR